MRYIVFLTLGDVLFAHLLLLLGMLYPIVYLFGKVLRITRLEERPFVQCELRGCRLGGVGDDWHYSASKSLYTRYCLYLYVGGVHVKVGIVKLLDELFFAKKSKLDGVGQ